MSYQRLAYHDQDTAGQMHEDCTACASRMSLPGQRLDPDQVAAPAPRLTWEEAGQERPKPVIEVSDAAAHLAARLHLHLD